MPDDITTTTTGNGQPHTTVIERRSGGGAGILIGFALLIAVAIGAVFLFNQNRNEAIKTDAITEAARSVERGADKVGEAAEKAGDAIRNEIGKN